MRTVDLRGRRSPYPIIEIAKIMKKAKPGETVTFLINDKDSVDDIYGWVKRTGNLLRQIVRKGDYWNVLITKRT
ncbi:MAG: hypothetical protein DRN78_04590 [Thermoproteota archaeon]|nr:sulfurtransferase TusA family protein [Candidatus Korarchaeota archaeon]RLG41158.1 MAG: hypothetical protein DRN78_04590 [Candidatus Korarchaeota archaeon]